MNLIGLLKRRWGRVLAGLLAILVAFLFPKWHEGTKQGGQRPAEPFRIAGNFYYVGASDVAAFLVTGPAGHILIDGGYPRTAPMIMASIAKLGFRIEDVEVVLNSEPHYDHAGGLAELQAASGAKLWASGPSAEALESGGAQDDNHWAYNLMVHAGILKYRAARVDRRVADGDTIRVGPVAITAHLTPGHSRGCTSWSTTVHEGDRELRILSACSLTLLPGMRFVEPERYPGIRSDFERTFATLRRLDPDIWVTSHARQFARYRKYAEGLKAKSPADPFIDREGFRAYVDTGEARFRREVAAQAAK